MAAGLGTELRTAFSNLLWKAISTPLEKVCRLLLVVVAARVLGQDAFGRFQFAVTVTVLLAAGTDLGLGIWTTRALARSRERAAAIVGMGLRVRLLAAIPCAALIGAIALAVAPGDTRRSLLLLGLCALIDAFVDHVGAVLRGHDRFDEEARLNALRAALVAAAGIAAVWLGRSVLWLAIGMAAASLIAGAHGLWIIGRRYHLPMPWGGGRLDRELARTAVYEGFPIWLAGLFSLLYFKGDTVLLRVFAGDAELGAYSAAFKIFEGSMLLPAILMTAVFPPLARAHGDATRQRRWETRITALLLAAGLLVGAACHLGSDRIIGLAYGPAFARAVPSLQVLAWGVPLLYLNHGLIYFLIARDLGRKTLVFAGLMLVINVAINLILIPRLGGPGAAWATTLTEAALMVCCLLTLAAKPPTASTTKPLSTAPPA